MTTATTALRDAADTIRDAAETGLQSIGGLLEDAKHRVDAVHVPKVSLPKKHKKRGWIGWLVLGGLVAVVAVVMNRRSSTNHASSSTSTSPVMAHPEPAAA